MWPEKHGKAFKFENTRQTLLKRVHSAGELLPINQFPSFTVSFWANVQGTGLIDLRLFSEGNTGNNNPLFNLGTASTGASGQLDVFIRRDPWPAVDHLKTVGEPLDGTWRHIVFTQQPDGARAVYVDGVKDELEIPAKPEGDWVVNTTTIGGILRANPTHWLTGMMDDVALWNRALSEAEITSVFKDGTPVPFTKPQPLAIRSFTADLPAVASGDKVILRWDVTKNVRVAIDSGVGDVTAQTVSGLGSIEVTLAQSKNFKLTLTRGTETLTATVAVAAIADVASGWTLIDNFDRYSEGNLNGKGEWKDLTPTGFSVVSVGGNPMLAPNGSEVGAVLPLRSLIINEGQKRTLFFRVHTRGDEAEAVRGEVVLTDRRIRFGSDVNNGPGARITDEQDELVRLGNANGYQAPLELFDPALDVETTYNVWVDINNGPLSTEAATTGDLISIYVQKASGGARTAVLQDFAADRDPVGIADTGFTQPYLDSLAIFGRTTQSATQNLLFDDIYLSKTGFLTTVPRAAGFTTPVAGENPSVAIQRSGTQVTITFGGGVLQSADAATGSWVDVSGATSPLSVPTAGAAKFYRVKQ
ncbi:MAG: LamG domain-containing protein [Verrucomicrobiales bacterium]|nr:LamG domain-containing protein [Verrucomicrobiales bacterium]